MIYISRMMLYYLLSWRTFFQQHLKSKTVIYELIILHTDISLLKLFVDVQKGVKKILY